MDAIDPEADLTIIKNLKSGQQVITMWSPSSHQAWICNRLSILKHALVVSDDTGFIKKLCGLLNFRRRTPRPNPLSEPGPLKVIFVLPTFPITFIFYNSFFTDSSHYGGDHA